MPFVSQAQRRKFASMLNEKKITKQVFDEWNAATGNKKLPERVGPKKPKSVEDLKSIRDRFGMRGKWECQKVRKFQRES